VLGCEKDENIQVLGDVDKTVLDVFADEDDRSE
jgi:hypothetical protein